MRRLAPDVVGPVHGASAARRGAIRRSLGRAAAALGAGQACGSAPVRRRRARRVSAMPSGRPPGRSRWLRKVSTVVVRPAFDGCRLRALVSGGLVAPLSAPIVWFGVGDFGFMVSAGERFGGSAVPVVGGTFAQPGIAGVGNRSGSRAY